MAKKPANGIGAGSGRAPDQPRDDSRGRFGSARGATGSGNARPRRTNDFAPYYAALAAANGAPPEEGDGGGGGGDAWAGDGGGGDSVAYEPDPALVAALLRLGQVEQLGLGQINAAEAQWRERLAALQAMQLAENASVQRTIAGDAAAQRATYDAAVNPITADLAGQGFTAAPIQQQAVMDQRNMADYAQRQTDLSRRYAEIQGRSFADRDAAATGQMAGSRGILANNIAQMRAELEAQIAGGGGGGGSGRGRSGRDSEDTLPQGVASWIAEANTPVVHPASTVVYTGRHQNLVRQLTNRVMAGRNLGAEFRQLQRTAERRGLNNSGFLKGVRRQVVQPIRKGMKSYRTSQRDQAIARTAAENWSG